MQENNQPSLGICVGPSKDNIRKAFFRLIKHRLLKYENNPFKEIIIFTKDNFNVNTLEVIGYSFFKLGKEVVRKGGRYALPNVVYVQSELTGDELQIFEPFLQGKVFNNYFYDKYEGYSLLKKNQKLRDHLPETKVLESADDLVTFFSKYNEVYLKPLKGYSGQGIFRVQLSNNGSLFISTTREQKNFSNVQSLWEWLISQNTVNNYIIQQGIEPIQWRGRATDIRLNMNKDGNGKWVVSFLIGRMARKGGFNSRGNINFVKVPLLLKKWFPNKNRRRLKRSIIQLGYLICQTFDSFNYNMGDIGIDLGMDKTGKIWIFEVNNLPHPFEKLNDSSLTLPFDYAYFLSNKP